MRDRMKHREEKTEIWITFNDDMMVEPHIKWCCSIKNCMWTKCMYDTAAFHSFTINKIFWHCNEWPLWEHRMPLYLATVIKVLYDTSIEHWIRKLSILLQFHFLFLSLSTLLLLILLLLLPPLSLLLKPESIYYLRWDTRDSFIVNKILCWTFRVVGQLTQFH